MFSFLCFECNTITFFTIFHFFKVSIRYMRPYMS
ncbi:hypothetical protein [Staphylococcus phage vB_SauM-V1SA19]|nr:hypothetical protein [Staphylococcus phage vB_SauM-V1SA19]